VRKVKLQGNLIDEALSVPDLGPVPDQPSFWSGVLRLQLTLYVANRVTVAAPTSGRGPRSVLTLAFRISP
jgi:hypothetical protein